MAAATSFSKFLLLAKGALVSGGQKMNDVNVEVEAEKWRNVDQWENDEGICVR